MRIRVWALVAVIVFGCSTAPVAPKPGLDQAAWYEPTDPTHVVGPIHYVGTRDLGVYLIATPAGHILIDGAMPGTEGTIETSIEKLGFETQDIRILLITHAHIDHVGTLAHFKKKTGAALLVMAPDDALLASGGKTDYLYASEPDMHFAPVTADRVLEDGDTVTLGGVELTARRTPGHTRGSTTWVTKVEDGGQTFSVVFPASTSINPGTRLVRQPSYPGIADDYRSSLDLLGSLEPDIFLPAHASFFDFAGKRARAATEGVLAYVDPDGYKSRIAEQRAKLEQALAK